jgi:hypothetical protein
MTISMESAFFAGSASAARVLGELTSLGVDPEGISIVHRDPPTVRDFGIRHPAASGDGRDGDGDAGDGLAGRLSRAGTLVMADLGFAIAGPLVEVLAEGRGAALAREAGTGAGLVAAALARLGLSEYEARYLEEAVTRGGTVLVVPIGEGTNRDVVRSFLWSAGGRKVHDAHERPPVFRA